MSIAWRIALAVAGISAILGILEGLGIQGLRPIGSHESFWEFTNTCLLVSIVFLLAQVLHDAHRGRQSWH